MPEKIVQFKIVLCLTFGLMLLPQQGYPEFYKYRDANGVPHFTGDLNEVPVDQRPHVKRYEEPDDALTPLQRLQKQKREEAARRRKTKTQSDKTSPSKNKSAYSIKKLAELNKKRAALEKQRVKLVKEQQALYKFNTRLADEKRLNAHKRKVAKLNKRIRAYESKRQQFELELAKHRLE